MIHRRLPQQQEKHKVQLVEGDVHWDLGEWQCKCFASYVLERGPCNAVATTHLALRLARVFSRGCSVGKSATEFQVRVQITTNQPNNSLDLSQL
jgi:hypothetical protein